jgi:hypothetical protein
MEPTIPQDQQDQIKAAIYAGRKIEAIRLLREATNSSLIESKVFVERLEAELRRTTPERFAPPRGGCAVQSAALILISVVGAWMGWWIISH